MIRKKITCTGWIDEIEKGINKIAWGLGPTKPGK
jgi:hypothetical protein